MFNSYEMELYSVPAHTTQLQGDLPTHLTHNNTHYTTTDNNTQQHTTTVHNSTQVHKTTNISVVFMALILRNDVALLKTITYLAIKTTGTLIVNM
jgi:hypothetical protein